ncbi:hypothetical protein RR46_00873 [Papilio xuthus]|uniref:Uncharacterized protein n=1 Tax=Papilio xuthus TaxID=66420 RepID=A0A0N1I4M1_PAPXU|nr:hypothetical protein RR46_00873 [Papilio xuthus]
MSYGGGWGRTRQSATAQLLQDNSEIWELLAHGARLASPRRATPTTTCCSRARTGYTRHAKP